MATGVTTSNGRLQAELAGFGGIQNAVGMSQVDLR
jgi:hypothetical protein